MKFLSLMLISDEQIHVFLKMIHDNTYLLKKRTVNEKTEFLNAELY